MNSNSQSGNVFFYIFLAIALFGSLSFAISQGSRGTIQNLTSEQVRLRSSEILDYTDTLAKAVATLRLRGTPAAEISFANNTDSDYGAPNTDAEKEVFNADGGGVIYHLPTKEATDGTANVYYEFVWNIAVKNIGTTCTTSSCTDLLVLLPHLKREVCIELNEMMDVDNPSGIPPTDSGANMTTPYTGTISYTDTIGDEAGSTALSAKTAGCYQDTGANTYVFYRALWSQ